MSLLFMRNFNLKVFRKIYLTRIGAAYTTIREYKFELDTSVEGKRYNISFEQF